MRVWIDVAVGHVLGRDAMVIVIRNSCYVLICCVTQIQALVARRNALVGSVILILLVVPDPALSAQT